MLTGPELAAESGLTYRQVDHWTTRGVLAPAAATSGNPGSGAPRNFAEEEARVARVLRALRELGASLEALAEAAHQLRQMPEPEWHGIVFVNTLGMVHRQGCPLGWAVDLDALLA